MKPHPRIRKTIKWGGAALTVLLVITWITSMWWFAEVIHSSGSGGALWGLHAGGVTLHTQDFPSGVTEWGTQWSARRTRFEHDWRPYSSFDFPQYRTRSVALWPFVLISIAVTVWAWWQDHRARRRANMHLCPKCHYDRTGLAGDAVCPECGTGSGTA